VDVQAPVAKIRWPHADGSLQIAQCLGTAQLVQAQQLGHAVQGFGMGGLLLQHLFIGVAGLLELPLFVQLAGLLQMLVRIHLGHQGCGQAPQHRPGTQASTHTNTAIVQASRQTRHPDKQAQTAFLPLLPSGPVTTCYKTGSTPWGCVPSSPWST
jgi:predicted lipid-binding transport protein (Tim44 family)